MGKHFSSQFLDSGDNGIFYCANLKLMLKNSGPACKKFRHGASSTAIRRAHTRPPDAESADRGIVGHIR
jgi:hypothetical protein